MCDVLVSVTPSIIWVCHQKWSGEEAGSQENKVLGRSLRRGNRMVGGYSKEVLHHHWQQAKYNSVRISTDFSTRGI